MPLILHRAERTDALAAGLGDLLTEPLPDPLEQDLVVVPAKGVERWLAHRLSHRLGSGTRGGDGVCAGVRFVRPQSLVTLLLGTDRDDPWLPHRLVWPLLAALDEGLDEPWAAPLAAHLGHGDDTPAGALRAGRRYALAHRLAIRFWQYGIQRPALLTAWGEGRDEDGTGAPLDDDLLWEPPLWRSLAGRIDAPTPDVRHERALAWLRAGGDAGGLDRLDRPEGLDQGEGLDRREGLDLPPRLSLFGHTRLARTEIELLAALAAHREVHLWLPHASPALWDALAGQVAGGPVPRADDPGVRVVEHPLLRSLGRDARELQRSLAAVTVEDRAAADPPPRTGTLLSRLQSDIAANRAPATGPGDPGLDPGDRSLQVHACHGQARQVEVLRDVLAGLLQDDPALQPREVLVMCPDIDTFAPLVQAAFGLDDITWEPGSTPPHPAHGLRVRLADRSLTATNPLLAVARRLLALAGGRVTASEVLDLASTAPVRRRFRLDDDDLDTIGTWVQQACVRWGLDGEHRGEFDLGGLAANTWAAGLDRLALGVARAAGPGHDLDEVMPLDDVDSGGIETAGAFLELLDRLAQLHARVRVAVTAQEWTDAVGEAVAGLTEVPLEDAWQQAQLRSELAAVRDAADPGTRLRLSDVQVLLERITAGRPTRASFRTGTLTACTLVPMRSVPHRVVCLLGMDDGVFPRTSVLDGDDALARRPLTGERDVRSEDRQLLLDAVMAAGDHLVITYSGASEHTGTRLPPAVPVGELLEAAAATAGVAPDRLVTRHPLQPFDPRAFTPGALGLPGPFGFDAAALQGARAAADPQPRTDLLVASALPGTVVTEVDLGELGRMLEDPARAFLRQRLDVTLPADGDAPQDAIPVELDSLQEWAVGDRIVSELLTGADAAQVARTLRAEGVLPPDELGRAVLAKVGRNAQQVADEALPLLGGPSRTVDVDVDLGGGRRLTGTVSGLRGTRLVTTGYSRLGPKQRLQTWVPLLALVAAHPQHPWEGHVAARGQGRRPGTARYLGLDPQQARGWLGELVDTHLRGLAEPLPLPVKTGYAYAGALLATQRTDAAGARHAARGDWEGGRFPGENATAAHTLLYGPGSRITVLLGPTRPDEVFNGATTRLGQYALRLWEPIRTVEQR